MNLSLVVVFVSILFMGGLIERLFREFSITLAAAITVSLAVSLTLTPSLCARWLKPASNHSAGRLARISTWFIERLRNTYARSLAWVIQHSTITLITLIGTIALTITLYIRIPKGFLPQQDTGQIMGIRSGR